jgi:hypothetical protein
VDLLKVRMSPADGFLKAVPATGTERKTIGIPLYSNFDSLDVLGPFQTFTMAADRLEPKLLAASKASVRSFEGVEITPHATFDETKSLDVLFVPGGTKLEDVLHSGGPDQNPLLAFLRRIGKPDKEKKPMLITSVCTRSFSGGRRAAAGIPGDNALELQIHSGHVSGCDRRRWLPAICD